VNHEYFVKNSGKPLQVININIAIKAFSLLLGFYVIVVLIAIINTWHRLLLMFKELNMYIEKLKHPVELGELDKIKTYYRRTVYAVEQSDEGANIFIAGFCVLLFSGITITVRRVANEIHFSENKFIYNNYIGLLITHTVLMTLALIITMKHAADINWESKLCLKYVNVLSSKASVVERTIEFDREVKLQANNKAYLTRNTHEVPRAFWETIYIFKKYSSRQTQRCISLPPQLSSRVKMRSKVFSKTSFGRSQ
jgi:hypothetical protein